MDGLTHRDRSNLAPLVESIRFPLKARGTLSAGIGRGRRESEALVAGGCVVVSRGGAVTGHSADLEEELWRVSMERQASLISVDDRVFLGTGTGRVIELDAASGSEVSATTSAIPGSLGAVGSHAFIIRTPPGLTAIGRDGAVRWRRDESSDVSGVSPDGKVLLSGLGREHIECVDEQTGATLWQFRPPAGPALALLHDCAIVGDEVVTVVRNRGVYRLRLSDGKVMAHGQPAFIGQSLIMEHAVAFAQDDRLIEFDFVAMKEASKVVYHNQVPRRPPSALCVARNAIVWTSDVGFVTGVTRVPGTTPAHCWEVATHAWGYLQTAVNPFVEGNFLYVQPLGAVALASFEMPDP